MSRGVRGILATFVTIVATGLAEEPSAVPADFKLVIDVYGLQKEPIENAELVVSKGIAYQFGTANDSEVVIFDRGNGRLSLLDLGRKIQTEATLATLDASMERRRGEIAAQVEAQEKKGGRANAVSAAMRRNLIEPKLAETYDAGARRLRMTNSSVEITATGEPETDPARLSLLADTLAAIAKLGALRDPSIVPPFPRLEALAALTSGHRLRPTELTLLYRLAGPPKKVRWTYRLVPTLTDREVEALSRVEMMRQKAPFVRFETYAAPPGDVRKSPSR